MTRHEEPVSAAPAPRIEAPQAPRVDSREMLAGSGLQMVETDNSKKFGTGQPEAEPVKLGRPRRERSAQPVQEELVQVETRDK